MRHRITQKEMGKDWMKYWNAEFELFSAVCNAVREASPPQVVIIQAKREGWTPCSEELPPVGADVILRFKDTLHTHPDWPKTAVKPAWICNVCEETPRGQWAIEGRLGDFIVDIDSGIEWMPMPE